MRGLTRLALALVPASWRDTVRADLEDEARAAGRGRAWVLAHIVATAIRMRWSFSGDVAMIDLRYAVRSLWHAKGFALAAVFTLVLGIGVNLAVFAIVDRALFRPLPFAHIDRLVMVSPYSVKQATRYTSFAKPLFVAGRQSVPAIEDMGFAGFTYTFAMGRPGDAQATLSLTEASYNLLDVLGTVPVMGRGFQREDAVAKRGVVVITYEAWQARFAGSDSILGVRIGEGASSKTIIGVLPPGFIAPVMNRSPRCEGLVLVPESLDTGSPKDAVDPAVARLAPGATVALAQEQYDAVAARLDPELRQPDMREGRRVLIEPVRQGMFAFFYQYLWIVSLAAALVGLLASANLASLLLARGRSREAQLALCASLGASRARLLIAELLQSLIICAVAAGTSLLILGGIGAGLRALVPSTLRQFVLDGVDARVVVAALVSAVVAIIVGGVLPAWRASRDGLVAVMKRGAGAPAHARSTRLGRVVLAFEAGVGVVLVAGAIIVLRSFIGLMTTDLGFAPSGLQVVRIPAVPAGTDPTAKLARYQRALDVLRRQPGILAAGGVDSMPAGMMAPETGAKWNGGESIGLWQITDGFLEAAGARLLAGRDVSRADVDEARAVALVSEAAARKIWPGEPNAAILGRELVAQKQPTRRVIGIVADLRDRPDRVAAPRVFAPALADGLRLLQLAVRSDRRGFNVEALKRAFNDEMGFDRISIAPAGEAVTMALEQPRLQTMIFGAFAIVGLLLAGLGLFAVASFDVALRRYEFGIRLALGASAAQIRRLIARESLRPVAIGAVIGLGVAYWAAAFAQSLVYETDVRSPWAFAGVALILFGTAGLAAWLPARRASRVDPAVVLRSQ